MISIFLYLMIGLISGVLVGLLGIGGGLIIIPGLLFIFESGHLIPEADLMHVASASALVIMTLSSLASIRAHYRMGHILWPVFNRLWQGVLLGVVLGVLVADSLSNAVLEVAFGCFLVFVASKMVVDLVVNREGHFPSPWVHWIITTCIGFLSGLLGIGGGALMVTYLNYCGVEYRKIAAVTNLCTFMIGLVGSGLLMFFGEKAMTETAYTTGYVYWPAVALVGIPSSLIAPWGAKLNYILPVKVLKYTLITVLFLMAFKMLF